MVAVQYLHTLHAHKKTEKENETKYEEVTTLRVVHLLAKME